MEVRELILLACCNKKKLVIIPVLAGLAVILILQMRPSIYEARGVVVIKGKSLASWMDSSDVTATENEFANIYSHLMKLRSFISGVSKRLPYEAEPALLDQAVNIDYELNSNTISISARMDNPEKAALLVNCVIDYFPLYLNEIKFDQPVTVNVIEKAKVPGQPLTANKIYIFCLSVFVAFFGILNIIMFSKCINKELHYEQTI